MALDGVAGVVPWAGVYHSQTAAGPVETKALRRLGSGTGEPVEVSRENEVGSMRELIVALLMVIPSLAAGQGMAGRDRPGRRGNC